jgi:hypothetical protein
LRVRRSTSRGPARPLRSALRVWLPSRRLTPSEPVPDLFHPGSAHGIRPSELSPLERYPRVSARMNPHTVPPDGAPAPASRDGPAQRAAVPGLLPFRESLAAGRGLTRRPLAAPLGFALLGFSSGLPCPEFRPGSSHALSRTPALRPAPAGASEYQSALRLALPASSGRPSETGRTTLLGFLHLYDPDRSSESKSGLWIHLMPRRASPPTDRQSLDSVALALLASPGTALGAEPLRPQRRKSKHNTRLRYRQMKSPAISR